MYAWQLQELLKNLFRLGLRQLQKWQRWVRRHTYRLVNANPRFYHQRADVSVEKLDATNLELVKHLNAVFDKLLTTNSKAGRFELAMSPYYQGTITWHGKPTAVETSFEAWDAFIQRLERDDEDLLGGPREMQCRTYNGRVVLEIFPSGAISYAHYLDQPEPSPC